MPNLTSEQLQEIKARAGTSDLSQLQFNIQTQNGEIIPAAINPSQAATIVLGGGVQTRIAPTPIVQTTPVQAQKMAQETVITPDMVTAELAKARKLQDEVAKVLEARKPASITPPSASPTGGSQPTIDLNQVKGATYTLPSGQTYTVPESPISSLVANTQISVLESKIADLRSKISAGIASGGKTQILQDLFTKYGVAEQAGIAKTLNTEIIKTQQELRDLPQNLKSRLENIGVSEAQLQAIIAKESQKPREILARLLEQRGAAQESINQALTFVRLFADTAFEDTAANLAANKFELEHLEGDYKDLRSDQRFLLGKAFDAKEDIMKLSLTPGLTPQEQADVLASTSVKEATQKVQPAIARKSAQDLSDKVADGIAPQLAGLSIQEQAKVIKDASVLYGIDPAILINSIKAAQIKQAKEESVVDVRQRRQDLADYLEDFSKYKSGDEAIADLIQKEASIKIKVGEEGYQKILTEINKKFPPPVPPPQQIQTKPFTSGETGLANVEITPVKGALEQVGIQLPGFSAIQQAYSNSVTNYLFK